MQVTEVLMALLGVVKSLGDWVEVSLKANLVLVASFVFLEVSAVPGKVQL